MDTIDANEFKYEDDLHYIDLGGSLRNSNDVIETRKQGDMILCTSAH